VKRPKVQQLRDAVAVARKQDMRNSEKRGYANGLICALSIMVPSEVFAGIEKPKSSRKSTTDQSTKKKSSRQ
jgi:hypothetical protein